ncbi:MAG: c-type cytochrome [Rhodopila sp.]
MLITLALVLGVGDAAKAQDAAAGEKTFVICRACHEIGPGAKNGVGPVLNGVVGRKAGTYPGYDYSEANRNSGIVWTPEELNRYLASPAKVVRHTKMLFPGLPNEQQRKNVIAFLEQLDQDGTKKAP